MNKYLLSLIIGILIFYNICIGKSAIANDVYFGGGIGIFLGDEIGKFKGPIENEYKLIQGNSISFDIYGGYKFHSRFEGELDFKYIPTTLINKGIGRLGSWQESINTPLYAFSGDFIFNIFTHKYQPYVGLGIGMIIYDLKSVRYFENVFYHPSFSPTIGLKVSILQRINIRVEARDYITPIKFDFKEQYYGLTFPKEFSKTTHNYIFTGGVSIIF